MNTSQAAQSSLVLGLATGLGVGAGTAPASVEFADTQQTACGGAGAALIVEVEPLKALCPSPLAGASPECREALDARYWNRPVLCDMHSYAQGWRRPKWWPHPRNDTVVWREVFEDPLTLRNRVEAATRDPACRLREHEFRPDLRETCAADSMARLGALHRACRRVLHWEEVTNPYFAGWQAEWDEWRETIDETEDDYWQQVAEFDESELHFAWLMTKCRAVPEAALAPLAQVRPSVYALTRYDQRDQLVVAAARLGSVWALVVSSPWTAWGHEAEVAVETWQEPPLPLAYASWPTQSGKWLPHLLAARDEDLAGDMSLIDWRGFEAAYTAEERAAARPVAATIRAHGWPPCCGRELGDSVWPWMDQPTPVRTKVLRRRIDEDGNVRWIYRNGREVWNDGCATYSGRPGETPTIGGGHREIGRDTLRRWTDADGTERWIDEVGDEHWVDADRAEHWIALDGTEWILLPVGAPFPDDAE